MAIRSLYRLFLLRLLHGVGRPMHLCNSHCCRAQQSNSAILHAILLEPDGSFGQMCIAVHRTLLVRVGLGKPLPESQIAWNKFSLRCRPTRHWGRFPEHVADCRLAAQSARFDFVLGSELSDLNSKLHCQE